MEKAFKELILALRSIGDALMGKIGKSEENSSGGFLKVINNPIGVKHCLVVSNNALHTHQILVESPIIYFEHNSDLNNLRKIYKSYYEFVKSDEVLNVFDSFVYQNNIGLEPYTILFYDNNDNNCLLDSSCINCSESFSVYNTFNSWEDLQNWYLTEEWENWINSDEFDIDICIEYPFYNTQKGKYHIDDEHYIIFVEGSSNNNGGNDNDNDDPSVVRSAKKSSSESEESFKSFIKVSATLSSFSYFQPFFLLHILKI